MTWGSSGFQNKDRKTGIPFNKFIYHQTIIWDLRIKANGIPKFYKISNHFSTGLPSRIPKMEKKESLKIYNVN